MNTTGPVPPVRPVQAPEPLRPSKREAEEAGEGHPAEQGRVRAGGGRVPAAGRPVWIPPPSAEGDRAEGERPAEAGVGRLRAAPDGLVHVRDAGSGAFGVAGGEATRPSGALTGPSGVGSPPAGAVSFPPDLLETVPPDVRPSFLRWWASHSPGPATAPVAAAFARWGWPLDAVLVRRLHDLWAGPPLHDSVRVMAGYLAGGSLDRSGFRNEKKELSARLLTRLEGWIRRGSSWLAGESPVEAVARIVREAERDSGVAVLREWLQRCVSTPRWWEADGPAAPPGLTQEDPASGETVAHLLQRWRAESSDLPEDVARAADRILTAFAVEAGLKVQGGGQPWVYQCLFWPLLDRPDVRSSALHVWRWAGRPPQPEEGGATPYFLTCRWRFPHLGLVEVALGVTGKRARLYVFGEEGRRPLLESAAWAELREAFGAMGLHLASVTVKPLVREEGVPPLSPEDLGWGPWDQRV